MTIPFYLQDEWIKIITKTAQAICRENYPDYMIHESDVFVTLKALSVVVMTIIKASKKRNTMKTTKARIKTPESHG